MGNHGEVFKLSDGSIWEVTYEYEYLYEYYPSVIICQSRGKMILNKKQLSIASIAAAQSGASLNNEKSGWTVFEETNLEGFIRGTVRRGRIFKTTSRNIYEVTGLTLQLVLEVQPSVLILRNGNTYKLIVDGFDEPFIARKVNASVGSQSGATSAARLPQGVTRGCPRVIETRVDGTFDGWTGDTIFKLTNGQIWMQSSYDYTYKYACQPEVMIFPSSGRCKMKVEDVNDTIEVTRLK